MMAVATWSCPKCGTEHGVGERRCTGCGDYVRLPRTLILASIATGKVVRMNVGVAVGRAMLLQLGDPDAKYASEPQFLIDRDESAGAWLVRTHPAARNATWYDGAPLTGARALASGGLISLGAERLRLTVTLEDA
jgi:hypothetical protein